MKPQTKDTISLIAILTVPVLFVLQVALATILDDRQLFLNSIYTLFIAGGISMLAFEIVSDIKTK